MLEEQATHTSGARQDEEQQKRWTSDSQVVTKSLSEWLNLKFTTDKTQWKNTRNGVPASPTGMGVLKT